MGSCQGRGGWDKSQLPTAEQSRAEEGRDGSSLCSGLPGQEESHPARPLRQSPVPTCLSPPLGVAALPSEFSPVVPPNPPSQQACPGPWGDSQQFSPSSHASPRLFHLSFAFWPPLPRLLPILPTPQWFRAPSSVR